MAAITDIKYIDDWDYFKFTRNNVVNCGTTYTKCAVAKEPITGTMQHAVLLIADNLTITVCPKDKYTWIIVGNLEKIQFEDLGIEIPKHTPREIVEQCICRWNVSLEALADADYSITTMNEDAAAGVEMEQIAQWLLAAECILDEFEKEGV